MRGRESGGRIDMASLRGRMRSAIAAQATISAIRQLVSIMYEGTPNVLADFGLTPRKGYTARTLEEKLAASRHTFGELAATRTGAVPLAPTRKAGVPSGDSCAGTAPTGWDTLTVVKRAATLLVVLAAIGVVVSCRDATEVTVEARTNVAWHANIDTSFTVGKPGQTEDAFSTTETRDPWGADGFVGSLVVVPGSAKDAPLSVKVVMGITRDPHACSIAQPDGCIFARRTLSYVPHRELHLPVFLYAQCEGIPCDVSTTCNFLGKCVPAAVDPASCDSPVGCSPPNDAPAPDGGAPPPPPDARDASTDAPHDAPADGPPQQMDGGDGGDAGAAGDVACGSAGTCRVPTNQCCVTNSDGGSASGACQAPGAMCPYGVLTCDGPEDCAPTEHCCISGSTAACAVNPCMPLCHGDGDCAGSTCMPGSFLGAYGQCSGSPP